MKDDFTPRSYQEHLADEARDQSSLIVLPTGLGKTIIAAMLIDDIVQDDEKAVFLAPTKPLLDQHVDTITEFIPRLADTATKISGDIKPKHRVTRFLDNNVIIATPQTLRNDLRDQKITLDGVSLLIFDEAHRGTGDYAYTQIAAAYNNNHPAPYIIGLTASPGSDKAKIKEIIDNLGIEHLAYRTRDDDDVKEYTHETEIDFREVTLQPGPKDVRTFLQSSLDDKINEATSLGYVKDNQGAYSRKTLLSYMQSLQRKLDEGEKHPRLFQSMSLIAQALKVQHALTLIESQGLKPLQDYVESIEDEAEAGETKAAQKLIEDGYFQAASRLADNLVDNGYEHPKMEELRSIVTDQINDDPESKIIIFTQFRDTAHNITAMLDDNDVEAKTFLGQAKKKRQGLSQNEQTAMLDEFRSETFNCLVSTSVGEEGLDIPDVDLVVFYEPVPSAIRSVQRRGRTGRHSKGSVITLITKDTRDEGIRWAAFNKEKKMKQALKDIQAELVGDDFETNKDTSPQKNLNDF
jgi:Fanconi anemia group M protein